MAKPNERAVDVEQELSFLCARCKVMRRATLKHWEIVRCQCGAFYWALQPNRGGPFKVYPWPGEASRLRNPHA